MKYFLLVVLIFFSTLSFSQFAQAQGSFINENPDIQNTSIPGFINDLYSFVLLIGGIIAVGMIVFGGVLYIFSAIPQKKGEGMEYIAGALWGLALLFGAYLILKTVNPRLVNLENPGGELPQAHFESGCTSSSTVTFSGTTRIVTKLPRCTENQWPYSSSGACTCYTDTVWLDNYNTGNYDVSEGSDFSNYDCGGQKIVGQAAAQAIISKGNGFVGKITYTNGEGRDRPDLGRADCSGFTHYLYQCVMGVSLENSGGLSTQPLPSDKLERITGPDKESKAEVGDIIGMTPSCKRQYISGARYGHVMIVAEKLGGKVTKVVDVAGKEGGPGGAHHRTPPSKLIAAFRDCGYLIHIKK